MVDVHLSRKHDFHWRHEYMINNNKRIAKIRCNKNIICLLWVFLSIYVLQVPHPGSNSPSLSHKPFSFVSLYGSPWSPRALQQGYLPFRTKTSLYRWPPTSILMEIAVAMVEREKFLGDSQLSWRKWGQEDYEVPSLRGCQWVGS